MLRLCLCFSSGFLAQVAVIPNYSKEVTVRTLQNPGNFMVLSKPFKVNHLSVNFATLTIILYTHPKRLMPLILMTSLQPKQWPLFLTTYSTITYISVQ